MVVSFCMERTSFVEEGRGYQREAMPGTAETTQLSAGKKSLEGICLQKYP